MKAAIVCRDPSEGFKQYLKSKGFKISNNPEVVFSVGGDGTFLVAERKYPSIPKVLLRDRSICIKCTDHKLDNLIKKLLAGKYKVKSHYKIRCRQKNKEKLCTNDFVVRNKLPGALRFRVVYGNKRIETIGDGIVVATSFGSSGYFKSITEKSFTKPMGVAFNNPVKPTKEIYTNLPLTISVVRGPAEFCCDNENTVKELKTGDMLTFTPSNIKANIFKF